MGSMISMSCSSSSESISMPIVMAGAAFFAAPAIYFSIKIGKLRFLSMKTA